MTTIGLFPVEFRKTDDGRKYLFINRNGQRFAGGIGGGFSGGNFSLSKRCEEGTILQREALHPFLIFHDPIDLFMASSFLKTCTLR